MTGRGSDTLSWDGWGRNTGGTYSSTSLSYSYDPAGNIRSRTGASTTTRYLYGGMGSPTFETDTSSTITLSYIQGPEGDIAHYAGPPTTGSTVTYLYQDGHGNLAATADNTGARPTTTVRPLRSSQRRRAQQHDHPAHLGRWDTQLDTTSNLIQLRPCPYDPTLGRFITTDPSTAVHSTPTTTPAKTNNRYDLSGIGGWSVLEVGRPSARGAGEVPHTAHIREPRGLSALNHVPSPMFAQPLLALTERADSKGDMEFDKLETKLGDPRGQYDEGKQATRASYALGANLSPRCASEREKDLDPSFRRVQAG